MKARAGCAARLTGQSGLTPSQAAALRQRPPAGLHTVPAATWQHAPDVSTHALVAAAAQGQARVH